MLDELKASIAHDIGCGKWTGSADIKGKCDCKRRKHIALLERLENPTEAMLGAGWVEMQMPSGGTKKVGDIFKAMLDAAQETTHE